jgi:hypothetical protein
VSTIQTSPNGILTQSAEGGVQISDLGAALGAGTTTFVRGTPGVNQAAMADIILASVTGGVARALLMPEMPVSSEVTFLLDLDATGGTVLIQETGGDGNADPITTQSSIATNVDFLIDKFVESGTAADAIHFGGATAAVSLDTLASAFIILRIKKIRESSLATVSDGWIVTQFDTLEWTT